MNAENQEIKHQMLPVESCVMGQVKKLCLRYKLKLYQREVGGTPLRVISS